MAYRPRLTTLLPPPPQLSASLPTPPSPARPARAVRDLQDQTRSEFSRGHLGIELKVPYVDETLWFVPNIEFAAQLVSEGIGRGRIWTAGELQDLASISPVARPDLERLVRVKAAFGADVVEVRVDVQPKGCRSCRGDRFWVSVHGATNCATCHPPADPRLVAEWITISGGRGA